jgi:hypothetical protein
MAHVSIYANPEVLIVQPCTELRRQRFNLEETAHFLAPTAAEHEIGFALLDALSRYKALAPEEIGKFFDLATVEKDYERWVTDLRERFGIKSRKALFQGMKHCSVDADEQTICVRPTKHKKLEAWGGTGMNGEDYGRVGRNASPAEIGRAVLAGLERCQ